MFFPAMDGWRRCIVVESLRLGSCKMEEKSWDAFTAGEHLHNGLISALHFFMHLICRRANTVELVRELFYLSISTPPAAIPFSVREGKNRALSTSKRQSLSNVFAENEEQRCSISNPFT